MYHTTADIIGDYMSSIGSCMYYTCELKLPMTTIDHIHALKVLTGSQEKGIVCAGLELQVNGIGMPTS